MKGKKSQLPFISLLVVNYNGKEILKICLPSLLKLEYPKNKYEIIIVDNASSDDSIEFLRKNYPKIKIIKNNQNLGYVGINSGIKYCKGGYIYFLNNDLILDKNCLLYLIKEIEKDSSIGMVAHTGINYYNDKLISGGTWVSKAMYCGHYPKNGTQSINEIPYMGAGIIKKRIIDLYGYLFDPDYFIYAEDLDLGLRIRSLGMKSIIVRNATCYHLHSVTSKEYSTPARNTYLLERNLLMTFFKIFSIKTILIYMPYVFGFRIISIIRDIFRFKLNIAWSRIKAIIWISLNFKLIINKRSKIQKFRKATDSYILKIFSEDYLLKKPFLV